MTPGVWGAWSQETHALRRHCSKDKRSSGLHQQLNGWQPAGSLSVKIRNFSSASVIFQHGIFVEWGPPTDSASSKNAPIHSQKNKQLDNLYVFFSFLELANQTRSVPWPQQTGPLPSLDKASQQFLRSTTTSTPTKFEAPLTIRRIFRTVEGIVSREHDLNFQVTLRHLQRW